MSEWKTYKLGELVDIQNGYAFKANDFSDKGIPVIKIKNIVVPRISFDDCEYFKGNIDKRLKQFIITKGDILISMTGSHINQIASAVGKVGKYQFDYPALLNQRVGKLFCKNEKLLNQDYFYYHISRFETQVDLASSAGGSANQANISPSQIKNLEITIPSLSTQTQIASILSSLDDKIELNLQMNQTLEAMAQAIFKEWFVDFNFPKSSEHNLQDYEMDKILDDNSKIKNLSNQLNPKNPVQDKLPKGWRMGSFEELTDIKTGKGLKRTEFKTDGIYPIIGSNGELGRTDKYLLDDKLILTGRVGTLGSIKISYGKKWYSDNVLIMKPYKYFYFTYFNLKAIDMNSLNRGSTQPLVTQTDLKNYSMLIPSNEIILLFEKTVNEMFEKIFINDVQIESLTQLRDSLLPKLMTGKIEIQA